MVPKRSVRILGEMSQGFPQPRIPEHAAGTEHPAPGVQLAQSTQPWARSWHYAHTLSFTPHRPELWGSRGLGLIFVVLQDVTHTHTHKLCPTLSGRAEDSPLSRSTILSRPGFISFPYSPAASIMVTIPAALYLLPLLILVGSQASFITLAKRTYELKIREAGKANPFDLGWARNWYAALCAPQGPKYMVRAAKPKAVTHRSRKARLLPQMSRLNTAPAELSSHRCPQDVPRQGRAAKAGAKRTWCPASPERKVNAAMKVPGMAEWPATADGGGGAHWKSQIHISSRAVSPMAALLSVSDI
ncbi:palmitoyltransferase ZDHHC19 isoform X1 [Dermochelys coriacea]|uniref:palmitoyltransferase ZDHHC19 isoform X1 n=1 Tax=Dermochelys coriacea TaxID=27794 RepID=UPI001CA7E696|nr:palmitoyltransferase ZDHHC19 isoform X1 [Dermochelys coriacea]